MKKKFYLTILIFFFTVLSYIFIRAYKNVDIYNYPEKDSCIFLQTEGFYHLNIKNLAFLDTFYYDTNGIRMVNYGGKTGLAYNPVMIGITILNLIPFKDDDKISNIIFKHLNFLLEYAQKTPKGNLLFPYYFDWPANNETAPWYSSMAQGIAASSFLWGYKICGDTTYFNAAKSCILSLLESNDKIKFYRQLESGIWLKEYPHFEYNVLDGSLFALAGVYDLYKSLQKNEPDYENVENFLNSAVEGFLSNANCFECILGNHYYSDDLFLADKNYYFINLALLEYLGNYNNKFIQARENFAIKSCSVFRSMIYVMYERAIHYLKYTGVKFMPCVK